MRTTSISLAVVALVATHAAAHALGAQQPDVVSGRVLDADGRPLAGALVAPLGARDAATLTDASGRFVLRVAPGTSALVAARLGFAPETLRVAAGAAAAGRE